ncbi:unnamed protein product [Trifolium pratense]|uniref:Uncharacterized protein n=1 Tax=Trifolium pratense TaxID=57577 RepID=A0ACB0KDV9_TRIPR|nr:unnamed protein product [Trifolium pratense]
MTITNYTPLLFFCFIISHVLSNVELHLLIVDPSTHTLQPFHEDINSNGSLTLLVKAEHGHSTPAKFLWHGSCTNKDISISQSRETLTGIPQYVVQIVNTCVSSECAPYNIHLHCGWFASARIINPKLFKRLSFDDCLVNGGKPLTSSQIIRFTYFNSFVYPLSFKSAKFC